MRCLFPTRKQVLKGFDHIKLQNDLKRISHHFKVQDLIFTCSYLMYQHCCRQTIQQHWYRNVISLNCLIVGNANPLVTSDEFNNWNFFQNDISQLTNQLLRSGPINLFINVYQKKVKQSIGKISPGQSFNVCNTDLLHDTQLTRLRILNGLRKVDGRPLHLGKRNRKDRSQKQKTRRHLVFVRFLSFVFVGLLFFSKFFRVPTWSTSYVLLTLFPMKRLTFIPEERCCCCCCCCCCCQCGGGCRCCVLFCCCRALDVFVAHSNRKNVR